MVLLCCLVLRVSVRFCVFLCDSACFSFFVVSACFCLFPSAFVFRRGIVFHVFLCFSVRFCVYLCAFVCF